MTVIEKVMKMLGYLGPVGEKLVNILRCMDKRIWWSYGRIAGQRQRKVGG